MGLFDDDFYSTKVSVRRNWKRGPGSSSTSDRWKFQIVIVSLISLLIGAVLTSAILLPGIVGNKVLDRETAPVFATGATWMTMNDAVIHAVAKAQPAIVSVVGSTSNDRHTAAGLGSGVLFQKDGKKSLVVTNNHVVQNMTELEVVLSTGERIEAKVVGWDEFTDLAVLEIEASAVESIAEFGNSDALRVGESAIAIGNPLGLGVTPTITVGVISSTHRTIPVSFSRDGTIDWEVDVIQTDAAINQGNSGGALVNLEGEVVGINSRKVADMGVEGLGFAIPINQVKPIVASLIEFGKVRRPLMGVTSVDLGLYLKGDGVDVLKLPDSVKDGVIVLTVSGPAEAAGLTESDVIVALDNLQIDGMLALRKYIYSNKSIGDKLKITYYRNGKKNSTTLVLDERQEP